MLLLFSHSVASKCGSTSIYITFLAHSKEADKKYLGSQMDFNQGHCSYVLDPAQHLGIYVARQKVEVGGVNECVKHD